jgi:hypothetical protein
MRAAGQAPSTDQPGYASNSLRDLRTRTGDMSTVGLYQCHNGGQPCPASLHHGPGVSRVVSEPLVPIVLRAIDRGLRRGARGHDKPCPWGGELR